MMFVFGTQYHSWKKTVTKTRNHWQLGKFLRSRLNLLSSISEAVLVGSVGAHGDSC